MEKAITKLKEHKKELQSLIDDSIKNQKTLRISLCEREMIGINQAIRILSKVN